MQQKWHVQNILQYYKMQLATVATENLQEIYAYKSYIFFPLNTEEYFKYIQTKIKQIFPK